MSSIAVCISVSEAACVLRDGKIVRVSGDCSLREVLQEVGLRDPVDNVLSVQTATTDMSSKQDAELDDEMQLHAEFKRRYMYFLLGRQSETESMSSSRSAGSFFLKTLPAHPAHLFPLHITPIRQFFLCGLM